MTLVARGLFPVSPVPAGDAGGMRDGISTDATASQEDRVTHVWSLCPHERSTLVEFDLAPALAAGFIHPRMKASAGGFHVDPPGVLGVGGTGTALGIVMAHAVCGLVVALVFEGIA
jgi:hypothetical protein